MVQLRHYYFSAQRVELFYATPWNKIKKGLQFYSQQLTSKSKELTHATDITKT
jgi:hypothetical protein